MGAKSNQLYKIRMKYQRSEVTDVDGLQKETANYLADNKPSPFELGILGGIFEYVSENIERDSIKCRSAEEWRALERQHVIKSSFTLPDLVDNLLRRLERGRITREQLEVERRQYKPCNHRFCLNYFIPQRKDAVYCSRDCKEREKQARAEYVRTSNLFDNGTYLPPSAYKVSHREDLEREYRQRERLFEPETLLEISSKQELEVGKRDRATEERKLRAWLIDEEVKGGGNPVNIEEMGNKPVKKNNLIVNKLK